jgi:hypothetical protein
MQEPERSTLQSSRRYVLGQEEDFYGVWDRESPGKPVETFPLTETGLQEATRRFAQLSQQDFWARFGPKALRWAMFAGLAVWIIAGLVASIGHAVDPSPDFGSGGPTPLVVGYPETASVRVAQALEDVAFRVWVAAVAIIVALRLLTRGREPT